VVVKKPDKDDAVLAIVYCCGTYWKELRVTDEVMVTGALRANRKGRDPDDRKSTKEMQGKIIRKA